MFVPHYKLKNLVKKLAMVLRQPLDYSALHPYRGLQARAHEETLDFLQAHMPRALAFDTQKELMADALKRMTLEGLILEFGVNQGGSVSFIARAVGTRTVDGFDSFEGLPEAWEGNAMPAGDLSNRGKLPRVPSNVRLHAGWFSDSLPRFLAAHPGQVAFLHVDSDIYSSAATIFEHLESRIGPGTVIVFDEYFNYPSWKTHEHRAFQEFLERTGLACEYVSYSFQQVGVVMR
jgi:hypothetical protein